MIAPTLQPIIAAGDVWEMVIGALFFILWTVAQLLGSRDEAKRKKKPARQRPRQPKPIELDDGFPQPVNQGPAGKNPADRGPRNQEEALRSEVEDFLRRAQGKPEQPKQVPRPEQLREQQPPRRPEPPRPVQPTVRTLQPASQPQQTKSTAAPPTAESRTLRAEGVAEHVARHLSTEDIAQHTQTLGAKVATSDDRLESRLQAKFDHELGSLKHEDKPADSKTQQPDAAAQIAAMLSQPEGMRQLIIANEILRRPEW